ncbi:response regulator [Candidatus Stoquefichus sp. SB1]|uniref:response regulator n=1 Tax=Candidatus Stoquefichus sp. SB1 TaxID=1658109 RepID=UPI0018E35498|nr:HD domain-containing phosphohydrolase [Candidatus Stoquefichus sp. SB1]
MNKKKVLIVDDVDINRMILSDAFHDRYIVMEAENGAVALEILMNQSIDVVLLDIVMPIMDGFQVLAEMKKNNMIDKIPVFLITAETTNQYLEKGYQLGAVDVITKPFNPSFIRRRIENIIELYSHRLHLQQIVDEQMKTLRIQEKQLREANRSVIDTLSTAIEFRDCESGAHVSRIRSMTRMLLYELRKNHYCELSDIEIELIGDAAVMHDVGKISIPDSILNKPGKLTAEEYEIMKMHTIKGCELLENIEQLKKSELYNYCYDICRHHHERWDGHGYPDGLKGNDISLWAQVVSLADVFDALVSERVYKKAYSYQEAMMMINNGECGVFQPRLLLDFNAISLKIYETLYKD